MKRKRLKHCAHVLCHMFRGWRLHSDWDALVRFGTGELKIDVLNEKCQHNGISIPPLAIAHELREWLVEDLRAHHIPIDGLKEAILEVELELGAPEPSTSGPEVPCSFHCRSQISTDGKIYTWMLEDHQFLIVNPDALHFKRGEKYKFVQECYRLAKKLRGS